MNGRDADVIVVGAGPAGIAAAIALATRGARVVLLDRSSFPRPKVCGDGLTPRALSALQRLGAWDRIEPYAQAVDGLRTIHLPSGAAWDGPLPSRLRGMPLRGAVVRREVLDELLRQRALELGASFVAGVAVDAIEQTGSESCIVGGRTCAGRWVGQARAVVIAAGACGSLGAASRMMPRPALEGIALRQYWSDVSVAAAFTICVPLETDSRPQAGYGWVFPVSERTANVGIGVYGVRDGRYVRRIYDKFIARLREMDSLWSRAKPCGGLQGGQLWSGVSPASMARGRIVCAGDAAAVANPFTGEGIAQALDSGELVALSLLEDFASPGSLEHAIGVGLHRWFPETRQIGQHLPWLASRGQQFVSEFWTAISPPTCTISAAVRRVALEEHLEASTASVAPLVGRTWHEMRRLLEGEYPLLAQLLEAIRAEAHCDVDAPIHAFWLDHRERQVGEIALLLGLSVTICVIAFETYERDERDSHVRRDEADWAINAVTLGAADVLMAQFFRVVAHVPSASSEHCARALTRALGDLSARIPIDQILATLALECGIAARAAFAEAA